MQASGETNGLSSEAHQGAAAENPSGDDRP
jgi:hypothetical protein